MIYVVFIDVLVVFREYSTKEVRVNFRSKSEFNVQKIAAYFGGGGHDKAAGLQLKGVIHDVVNKVIQRLENSLKHDQRLSIS